MDFVFSPAPDDRQSRILAIEAAAKSICEQARGNRADCVMLLLTAAVRLETRNTTGPLKDVLESLATKLGEAIVDADSMFKPKPN